MSEELQTFTAYFDVTTHSWVRNDECVIIPGPDSPVAVLERKIATGEVLNHEEFFTWLFMYEMNCSARSEEIINWILSQGDLTTDSKLSFDAWKGLYFAYNHVHAKMEMVSRKEYDVILALRNWGK